MEANELIERYIHEVGRHLPRANREDIKLELKSLLLDTIEVQTADTGQPPTGKMVAEYLKEFGRPEEIAANYHTHKALIGPRIFPYFRTVLTITLAIIAALHLLGLIFFLIQNGFTDIIQTIVDLTLAFGRTALITFGIMTLVFAALERVEGIDLKAEGEKSGDWDPFELPPLEDPDRIDRFEMFIGIFFGVLFIIAFNFFYEYIGFIDFTGDDKGIIPFLSEVFRPHVPWLTASFALDILLRLVVLAQGHWNRATRWIQLAVEAFSLFVLYRILVSDVISTVPIFTTMTKIGIIVVIIIDAIEMVGILTRLLIGRPLSPRSLFKSPII